jgi:two-component system sensor histidine kinase VicK
MDLHSERKIKTESDKSRAMQFLSGGGEMGVLMREYNWADSLLGPIDLWPQSLLTALAIILNSKFPMFLFWGPELVCFYNDAYRPSLGMKGKHPSILGMEGEKAWPEIWPIIKPQIDIVLAGGEATWYEDQLIPIYRNGKIEDVYWTFSYSQVKEESGKPGGVFVTCTETTGKVNNLKKLAEANDQLNFAIEATELGTWDYDPATNMLTGNSRIKDWFGLSKEEEIRLDDAIVVIVENDRERVTKAIELVLQPGSGGHYEIEYTIKNPVNLQQRIVMAKGKAWFNRDNICCRFNGTLQDITKQTFSLRKIEASETKFRMLSETIHHMIWTAEPDGRKNFFNKYFIDYSGLSFEQLKDNNWQEIIHPEDLEKELQQWEHTLITGEDFNFEKRLRRHDGVYRWLLCHGIPQKDTEGNITGWIGTNTDIHDQKIKELQKDEFISIASHEMRTPLTAAKGYIQLLKMILNQEASPAAAYAEKANSSLDRLHNLIAQLLDASKIQNGKLDYHIASFDFDKMLEETIETIQVGATNHIIHLEGKAGKELTGDKDRLQQVLINLLNNAIKYSPNAKEVKVLLTEKDNILRVAIKDFGIGISAQHLDNIFERYYRIEEHAANFQGLGIGLYISAEIIRRHAGILEVESEVGNGSTFFFIIPVG